MYSTLPQERTLSSHRSYVLLPLRFPASSAMLSRYLLFSSPLENLPLCVGDPLASDQHFLPWVNIVGERVASITVGIDVDGIRRENQGVMTHPDFISQPPVDVFTICVDDPQSQSIAPDPALGSHTPLWQPASACF